MVSKPITKKRGELVDKVSEMDKKFIGVAFDAVMDYSKKVENEPEKCTSDGKIGPSMVDEECAGMPFVDETRIRQVADVILRRRALGEENPGRSWNLTPPSEITWRVFAHV